MTKTEDYIRFFSNAISREILATPIERLGLPTKICKHLRHIGIKTFDNLVIKAALDQSWIKDMDVALFRKIEKLLAKYGLNLLDLL